VSIVSPQIIVPSAQKRRPRWGEIRTRFPVEFSRIADTLARVFMTVDARLEPPTLRGFGFRGEPVKIFTVEGSGRRLHWALPSRLRHRQRLLGEVGELMGSS